jgi:4-amino-4-deoxy-L-arabinose transferase-like glycosyltransferase
MIDLKTRRDSFGKPALFLAIALFSFSLRIVNADTLNNNISDLGARYVLICYDIIQGVYHFPRAPWVMEYDETSFCWLMVPWILLWGRHWAVFRLFGACVTALAPPVLFLIVSRKFNLRLGIIAGLFFASVPAQLVWDRYLIMSTSAIQTILWLTALYLVSHAAPRKIRHYAQAGAALGVGMYFAHYNAIIFPTLFLLILLRKDSLRHKLAGMTLSTAAYLFICSPVVFYLLKNPEYVVWRQRHFHENTVETAALVQQYLVSKIEFIKALFGGGTESLYLRSEAAVLNPLMAFLFLAGIIFLIRRGWSDFLFVLGLPLTLYVMLGLIKSENWSGAYHVFSMPFLSLCAAFGAYGLSTCLTRRGRNRMGGMVMIALTILVVVTNSLHFFRGAYKIHPRPDVLTRLQADMKDLEKIPYLFSTGISEVQHYHMPFWAATRCYHDRISIFGRQKNTWISDPDKQPFNFTLNENNRVGIIMHPGESDTFIEHFGQGGIADMKILPKSRLKMFVCAVDVPELLQRTWTASYVPPLLPIKRD